MTERLSNDKQNAQSQCTDPISRCHICAPNMHDKDLTEATIRPGCTGPVTMQAPEGVGKITTSSLFLYIWQHWLLMLVL